MRTRSAMMATVATVVLALLLGAGLLRAADVITLRDGRRYEGEILHQNEEEVHLKTKLGIIPIKREDIAKIERVDTPLEQYQRRSKACAPTAEGHYALGLWCKGQPLESEARHEFRTAYGLDPTHEGVLSELGIGREIDSPPLDFGPGGYVQAPGGAAEEFDADPEGSGQDDGNDAGTGAGKTKPKGKEPTGEGGRAEEVKKPPSEDRWWDWVEDRSGGGVWAAAQTLNTEHYDIQSNVDGAHLKRYAVVLESMFQRLQGVFAVSGEKTPRCRVKIYKTPEEFKQHEAATLGNFGSTDTIGGFYRSQGQLGEVVCYHGKFGPSGNTVTVLFHEGTHQFEHLAAGKAYYGLPTWLKEGISVLIESGQIDRKTLKVTLGQIPRDRADVLKRAVQTDTHVSLRDLIRTPQSRFTAFHYAHAWGLVYFLTNVVKKQDRDVFMTYYQGCLAGKTQPQDFETAVGLPMPELEKRWKEWVLGL